MGKVFIASGIRLFREQILDGSFIAMALLFLLSGFCCTALAVLDQISVLSFWSLFGLQVASGKRVLAMCLAFRQAQRQCALAECDIRRERGFRQRQSRFLGMLSHELKTPLAVIDGAAQSLRQLPGGEYPEVERRHRRIRKAVQRIEALLGQCLTQDRLDDAGLALQPRPFDLAELARAIAEDHPDEKARVAVDAPPTLSLQGDAALLRIALHNLIDNALKYSPPHAPVFLVLREESRGVAVEVADGGPGIPPALGERIFEPFVRGEHLGDTAGAGLGLYLVSRIAELHQGRVTLAESRRGACFRLWLPMQ